MNAGIFGGIAAAAALCSSFGKHEDSQKHFTKQPWREFELVKTWLDKENTLEDKIALCHRLSMISMPELNLETAVKAHLDRLEFERIKKYEAERRNDYIHII